MPDRDRALHATKAAALDPPGRAPSKAAPVHEAQEELRSGAEDVRGCRLNLLYDLRTVRIDVCILPYIGMHVCKRVEPNGMREARCACVECGVPMCRPLLPPSARSTLGTSRSPLQSSDSGDGESSVACLDTCVHAASRERDPRLGFTLLYAEHVTPRPHARPALID